MRQVRQDCHNPKGMVRVRANKATVDIWAIRCMVSRDRNTVEAQEAWVVGITNLEDRIIKPVGTELTGLGMAQDSMETATAVDGVPIMGTEFWKSPCMQKYYFPTTDWFFYFGVHSSLAKMV